VADPDLLELGREGLHRLIDGALANLTARGELLRDLFVLLGLEVFEREVLELPLDLPDAEPVGQRCVDLERLTGDALLLVGRERPERAHVVEPVAEFDDHDPQVVGHRQEHLPDVLGLMRVARLPLKTTELRDALHQTPDLVAELEPDVFGGARRVLGHVVQQRRRDGRRLHAELGDEHRHRGGMCDVRLARDALLSVVRLGRVCVRATHQLRVAVGIVPEHLFDDAFGVDGAVAPRTQTLGDADDP
jgi:hypothetical protein